MCLASTLAILKRTTDWLIKMTSKEKSQLERFKEAARQLETDDDEDRFEKKLKKLVKQKPKDDESQDDGKGGNDG